MSRCDFVLWLLQLSSSLLKRKVESARSGGAMQLLRARRAAACEVLLFTMSN